MADNDHWRPESWSDAIEDIGRELDSQRERLETLVDDVKQFEGVGIAEITEVETAETYELRLRVGYRPPESSDGSAEWTVPETLLQWADGQGLLLRDTFVLRDSGFMSADFAPREETPHDPHLIVLDEFAALFAAGLSTAQALDYWATEYAGKSQVEWSEIRGVNRQTINDRVTEVREQFDE